MHMTQATVVCGEQDLIPTQKCDQYFTDVNLKLAYFSAALFHLQLFLVHFSSQWHLCISITPRYYKMSYFYYNPHDIY